MSGFYGCLILFDIVSLAIYLFRGVTRGFLLFVSEVLVFIVAAIFANEIVNSSGYWFYFIIVLPFVVERALFEWWKRNTYKD